jgi:hypothetical protein
MHFVCLMALLTKILWGEISLFQLADRHERHIKRRSLNGLIITAWVNVCINLRETGTHTETVNSATRVHEHAGVLCYKRSFSEQQKVLEVFRKARPSLFSSIFFSNLSFKPYFVVLFKIGNKIDNTINFQTAENVTNKNVWFMEYFSQKQFNSILFCLFYMQIFTRRTSIKKLKV